jgi:DNA (cytosine-5)-methyltransferase 1
MNSFSGLKHHTRPGQHDVVVHAISLFSGVGMLDEGVAAALRFHGQDLRTVCYVEREAGAAGQLVALMEEGCVHPAPVWSDVTTFDARAWSGKVDCIIAGFPCQDLSVAGKREGLDGKRSGLFFEILRIAADCGAGSLFLENVSGIVSAGASAVHPELGALEERACSRVLGELADLGWNAEWCHVRASDVGASHRRERWFCFAWLANSARRGWRVGGESSGEGRLTDWGGAHVADSQNQRRREKGECIAKELRARVSEPSAELVDAVGKRWAQTGAGHSLNTGEELEPRGGDLANPDGKRRQQDPAGAPCNEVSDEGRGEEHDHIAASTGSGMAHASKQGPQRSEQPGAMPCDRGGQEAHGSISELRGLFAPGPASVQWPGILANSPGLAPATQPGVRVLVDGLAVVLDTERAAQLRSIGNGVVPLQAGFGFAVLIERAELMDSSNATHGEAA